MSDAHAISSPLEPAGPRAAAEFLARFGREPAGVWSAPGRVNLIGEHTDYNEGFALPFAIGQRTFVAAAPRADARLRVATDAFADAVEVGIADLTRLFPRREDAGAADLPPVPEWAAYPLGVAWALLEQAGGNNGGSNGGASNTTDTGSHPDTGRNTETATDTGPLTGYDLLFTSDVPLGAGLSSSAALESATAVAFNELWGLGFDRRTLARAGQRAENEAVGAPTGIMDQTATLLGEVDHGVLIDCRDLTTDLVPLHFGDEHLELLVIDTRVRHAHATGGYGERRASCEKGAATLGHPSLRTVTIADLPGAEHTLDDVTFRRVRHIVTENSRVQETVAQLAATGPRSIGPLLTASHVSLRDDFEVSVPELDLAVEAAIAAGALGARMTGGGFGGAAIALIDVSLAEQVTAAVLAAFAREGLTTPHVFAVIPGAGAAREQ
ncbi:galactokinase [Leucobacter sp. HY1910]